MRTDVLIVGAGPTGLALACQLARLGIDFLAIEKRETTTPFSKAIGVQARTLEIYEQLGIAQKLIDAGAKANGVRLVEDGRVRGEVNLVNFGDGLSPYPFLLVAEQGKHEKILYDLLRSYGKDIRWNTTLDKFSYDEKGVTANITNADGSEEIIDAKFIVGCDGAHSIVRHTLGIELSGSTFERLFYVADVKIDWEYSSDWLHINLGKNTLTAFFPMVGEKNWRVVGTFPEGSKKEESEILYEEIEEQIRKDTNLVFDITEVNWFSVYKVHSRAVGAFSRGTCFLAGDSAHIHTPAGAQGMNTGIQDGYNLAWKLAAVLKFGADARLLDTYNEERLPNARSLLNTTDRLFDIAASDEWYMSFFRLHILPHIASYITDIDAFRKFIFPLISQIGISYDKSSLSKMDGSFDVVAGARMPWFESEGRSIYDNFREPKFHVVFFSDEIINAAFDPDLVDVYSFPLSERVTEIFGTDEPFQIVLRPDNYIGFIANGIDPEKAAEYLRDVIRNG
jgi:2-polyprenyl-6-methoxyphenol hydroxylase-like FAD-dependent oxidoreductase